MSEKSVAQRYAKALLSIAEEQKALQPVAKDLEALAELERGSPELHAAWRNPVITLEERRGIVTAIAAKGDFHAVTKTFLNLVTDKGRLACLGDIAAAFQHLADERMGRVRAEVRATAPLLPQELEEIKQALATKTGKQIVLETAIDPELLGGVVARVGDTVYDSSLRSHLNRIRSSILSV